MSLIPLKLPYSAEADQIEKLTPSLPSLHRPALMPCLLARSWMAGWRNDRGGEEQEREIGATLSLLHSQYLSRHRRTHLYTRSRNAFKSAWRLNCCICATLHSKHLVRGRRYFPASDETMNRMAMCTAPRLCATTKQTQSIWKVFSLSFPQHHRRTRLLAKLFAPVLI